MLLLKLQKLEHVAPTDLGQLFQNDDTAVVELDAALLRTLQKGSYRRNTFWINAGFA